MAKKKHCVHCGNPHVENGDLCGGCKSRNKKKALYCSKCGAKLKEGVCPHNH